MAFNEDSSGSGQDEPWIQWFCKLKGHEMFCEVERSYIEDGFNLYGLRACVSNFSDCLDLILDRFGPDDDSDDSQLTQSACSLYGLIHARYILTAHGLDAMYAKYAAKEFGTCPLIRCGAQPVLPVGIKDELKAGPVRIYCPKCSQIYHPPPARSRSGISAGVDGAAFGTTFAHLFLMTFSNLVPDPLSAESAYVPRVFGFRVHKSARQKYLQAQQQQQDHDQQQQAQQQQAQQAQQAQQQQQQTQQVPPPPQLPAAAVAALAAPVVEAARPDTPRTNNEQPSNNSSNQEQAVATEEKRSRRRKRDAEQAKVANNNNNSNNNREATENDGGGGGVGEGNTTTTTITTTIKKRRRNINANNNNSNNT